MEIKVAKSVSHFQGRQEQINGSAMWETGEEEAGRQASSER